MDEINGPMLDPEFEKKFMKGTALAIGGFGILMLGAAAAILVTGAIDMTPHQRIELLQQAVDAIPAIVVGAIGTVAAIATVGILLDRRDARRVNSQNTTKRRRP